MKSRDIKDLLAEWPFEPGHISVRRITGADNRPRIQMRIDLGILQFETSGRPDGQRPHGHESLLHYQLARLRRYRKANGTDLGFELTPQECRDLRAEAAQYYHRYLSLFVLEDYEGVERDTARNLKVLDLCRRYAAETDDRYMLEPYRPYVLMMHYRARAQRAIHQRQWARAMEATEEGLAMIRQALEEMGQERLFRHCPEAQLLRRLRRQIRKHLPPDPLRMLEKQLTRAIAEEAYEEAARIRDRIAQLRARQRRA